MNFKKEISQLIFYSQSANNIATLHGIYTFRNNEIIFFSFSFILNIKLLLMNIFYCPKTLPNSNTQ